MNDLRLTWFRGVFTWGRTQELHNGRTSSCPRFWKNLFCWCSSAAFGIVALFRDPATADEVAVLFLTGGQNHYARASASGSFSFWCFWMIIMVLNGIGKIWICWEEKFFGTKRRFQGFSFVSCVCLVGEGRWGKNFLCIVILGMAKRKVFFKGFIPSVGPALNLRKWCWKLESARSFFYGPLLLIQMPC